MRTTADDVLALLARRDSLRAREVVRLDAGIRAVGLRSAPQRAGMVLALASADGHERQRAVEAIDANAPDDLVANLLALRAVDWAEPVRAAALAKLRELPQLTLLYLLPMVERLRPRARSGALVALFEERIDPDALRVTAGGHPDPLARRSAWRLLIDTRESLYADDLVDVLALDRDAAVRAIAPHAVDLLLQLESDHEWFRAATERALVARNPAVRRVAREWARVRGVDARWSYAKAPPERALALIGRAEIAWPSDAKVIAHLIRDPRARVSAAALRALANLSPHSVRDEARELLLTTRSRRVARAAALVLRAAGLADRDRDALAAVAVDRRRRAADRRRCMELLERAPWLHLAVLLRVHAQRDSPLAEFVRRELRAWPRRHARPFHGPGDLRGELMAWVPGLDDPPRSAIDGILRASAGQPAEPPGVP